MEPKYSDLYELIDSDENAKKYFAELPYYVKQSISQRASGVNSFESLRHYADNLTRGDG